jgi:hypothetical protein
VFEIGRRKEFDLSVKGGTDKCASAITCPDVTPKPPELRPALSRLDGWWVAAAGLVIATVLAFSSGARDILVHSFRGWRGPLAWAAALACAASIFLFFVGGGAARFEEDRPEPFSWDGGVSMWPTELVRVIALLLALAFSFLAARIVRGAARSMTEQYCLDPFPVALAPPPTRGASHGRWLTLYEAVTLQGFDRIACRLPVDSVQLWGEYLQQSRGWRRNVRVVLSMFLAFGMVFCLMQYFGFPHLPARGTIIRRVDFGLLFLLCMPVVLWLQMYTVDVIRLCDKVTRGLTAERPTLWPPGARDQSWLAPATNGHAASGEGSQPARVAWGPPSRSALTDVAAVPLAGTSTATAVDDDVSYWLDIRFTAQWTAAMSWLVYLPFTVICLMMVARNRFFDDWDTPPGLYVGFGLSLAYIVGCVVALMVRATRLRRNALRHLRARLRRLLGSGAGAADLDRVKLMIDDVERADEGAFAPLTRQPILGALAVMFGGAGISAVVQYLMGVR